jgi:hypothetical protein
MEAAAWLMHFVRILQGARTKLHTEDKFPNLLPLPDVFDCLLGLLESEDRVDQIIEWRL